MLVNRHQRFFNFMSESMSDRIAIETILRARASDQCELCKSENDLRAVHVAPFEDDEPEHNALLCDMCRTQIDGENENLDPKHWFGLQESIWSEVPSVQVLSWRMLNRLKSESFAQDLLEQAYLADDVMEWAKQGVADETHAYPPAFDSNGAQLNEGDSVTLIKDLDVKGTSFVGKRGTLVKGIRLTADPTHVEGRVNSIMIVLKTEFLKKA